MKKRTKEESAAYFREYRARKKGQAATPATLSPKKGAIPDCRNTQSATPAPCPSCAAHSASLATAQERISMLEGQLAAARCTVSATPSAHKVTPEDAEALRQRVIAEKTNRINTFGRNPVIGSARLL